MYILVTALALKTESLCQISMQTTGPRLVFHLGSNRKMLILRQNIRICLLFILHLLSKVDGRCSTFAN